MTSTATAGGLKGMGENDQLVLQALSIFTPITTGLLALEHSLYDLAEQLPRSLFKLFRALRDDIETLFSCISACSSEDQRFNDQKDAYLQEQIRLMEAEVNTKPPLRDRPAQSRSRAGEQPRRLRAGDQEWQLRAQLLARQVESLKHELRRNDSEYEIEIKKYNYKYQEMQEEIDYYRRQSQRSQEYLEAIEGLEVELRAMEEARERDQQLIQNMAWKLRNLERERYGRSAFLSPKSTKAPPFNSSFSRLQAQFSPKSHLYSRDE